MANDREIRRLAEAAWPYVSQEPWDSLDEAGKIEFARVVNAVNTAAMQPPTAPQLPFDGRPVHDQTASVASLARTILADCKGHQNYTLPVPRLELLLRTLLMLADPPQANAMRDTAGRTVSAFLTQARSEATRFGETP